MTQNHLMMRNLAQQKVNLLQPYACLSKDVHSVFKRFLTTLQSGKMYIRHLFRYVNRTKTKGDWSIHQEVYQLYGKCQSFNN